jgi:hypothetical protein
MSEINLADFTPTEQTCISNKAQKLIDEGYEKDQAVAIAIKHCAPDKAKAEAQLSDSGLPGGNYTASQNSDGTWDIFDIPIMGEMREGQKAAPGHIGQEWLQCAVDSAQKALREDNYLPPLHIKHHKPGEQTRRAGFFLLTRVGKMKYQGKLMYAIFADFKKVPAEVFAEIERGEVPYRSVEIASWEDPKIASLALLDDAAPFFQFELLTIGRKVLARSYAPDKVTSFYRGTIPQDSGALVLCHFDTPITLEKKSMPMPDEKKPEEKKEKITDPDAKPEGDKVKLEPQNKCCEHCAGMYEMMKKMLEMEMAENLSLPTQHKEEMKPAEMPAGKPTQGGVKMGSEPEIKLSELAGEVAALREQAKKREEQDQLVSRVKSAKESLKGWPMSSDTEVQLSVIAEKGEDAIKAFVDAYKKNVPKEPPRSFSELESKKSEATPEEVLAYSGTPEQLERARVYAQLWQDAKSLRLTDVPMKKFIEIQMSREAK